MTTNKLIDSGRNVLILVLAALSILWFALTIVNNMALEDSRQQYSDLRNNYLDLQREHSVMESEYNSLRVEKVEELLAEQTREKVAWEECVRQVQVSMADVTVDALGNPLNVTSFAEETCTTERDNTTHEAFVERFQVQG